MASSKLKEYISKPRCIGEFSSDRDGNILKNKTENKCYLYEKFTDQDMMCLNLKSSQIEFEDKTKEMEANLRRSILKKLIIPGFTLKKSLSGADFYCSSGILTKFATSHLQHKTINVACIKIDGVIIMVDIKEPERKRTLVDNLQFTSSDSSSADESEKVDPVVKDFRCENTLKYVAFLKRNSTNGKPIYKEGVKAWKQYRRAYVTKIMDPDNEGEPLKIAYNSIIHCVDEDTDKPVIVKTRPSYIDDDDFIWRSNVASKMYMESILLNSDKVAVGERDKNSIVHRTKIGKPSEVLQKSSLDEQTLCKNLCFVLNKIKNAFEIDENDCVKYVNVMKWCVTDKYHIKCYGEIPKDELCIRVFGDF
uniref:Decapping nuclease n=1 Tax=Strongyloides papillosus TaxID=174720 RepID=A0A0N5BTJ7_STREA